MSLYLSIIIPAYNEEPTILSILKKIHNLKLNINKEIIIIDDCSSDQTHKILLENQHLYSKLLRNSANKGKGYSIKKALKHAKGKYIIFQDADLEYDPNDYIKFIDICNKFNPDLIIGSRIRYADYTRSHNFYNKIGNNLITTIFNLRHNTTFTDIYSCYVLYKRDLLNFKELKTNGFEQQAEILKMIVKKGKLFYEVPINYSGRTISEGKKIRWYSIFKVIYQIL